MKWKLGLYRGIYIYIYMKVAASALDSGVSHDQGSLSLEVRKKQSSTSRRILRQSCVCRTRTGWKLKTAQTTAVREAGHVGDVVSSTGVWMTSVPVLSAVKSLRPQHVCLVDRSILGSKGAGELVGNRWVIYGQWKRKRKLI